MAGEEDHNHNHNQTQQQRQREEAEEEEEEAVELILFRANECYVYMIPPRKTAASYRADEWDVNKWNWEGTVKVVSKGEECIIKLEDKTTGELYARAFLRNREPHPVEPVINSSRYFVLRVEENIGGRLRHAFIGIGFRERTQAYDFQAALYDHMKYLNKKKTAEEMEQHYQKTSSVDYSLKEGETLVLQINNNGSGGVKSALFAQGLNNLPLEDNTKVKGGTISLKPPPYPPGPLSPIGTALKSPTTPISTSSHRPTAAAAATHSAVETTLRDAHRFSEEKNSQDTVEDDFGDFQAAA
ncbi:uncharacterized protein M6B38_163880 [Iris pallida]|uniref:NECAP PHear domain-containing protein n=1 Tax=Iris pallida TaxID=29817 RepID=A0AAX6EXR6_IRIPA|nr:uncharacterized protein M6B38_163880 [Iris pallida]